MDLSVSEIFPLGTHKVSVDLLIIIEIIQILIAP